jgi:multidrug efflux pump subunit AcrA (membrane-fusion protein)
VVGSTPLVRGRIVERCRCEGKAVKSGDLLARLDDKEASATLNDLRALEDFQHRKFDRQAQLLARGASTFFRIDPSEVVMDPDPADDARRQRAPLIPSRVKYDRAFF